MIDTERIEAFLNHQTEHWNQGDKQAFLEDYRRVAPEGLSIEYVGRAPQDGWSVLEQMWEQQRAKIRVEPVVKIVNGNEAACHVRNVIVGTGRAIETIELFRFEAGRLYVRYFIKP
ncbi:nuclear transport factor 2 family protein [Cupriavidus pinatubonensis]|uniref:SnoaL-like domain-containing protein n=1 Tax=Cupriavidus pinatubonensis TaxID=248026 RepID=A0ABN7Y0R9_9BURK|nr:nuclear transport factor 2 family protein [Cupriavidus pinatubonensis]CAG9166036.1 hypothetical protein LMG23994_00883 [Cupriavidus pinatubonensis]